MDDAGRLFEQALHPNVLSHCFMTSTPAGGDGREPLHIETGQVRLSEETTGPTMVRWSGRPTLGPERRGLTGSIHEAWGCRGLGSRLQPMPGNERLPGPVNRRSSFTPCGQPGLPRRHCYWRHMRSSSALLRIGSAQSRAGPRVKRQTTCHYLVYEGGRP